MNAEYRDFIFAARIIDKANGMLGNGDRCSWTADGFRDLASSIAAQAGMPGVCPMCNTPVYSSDTARVRKHRNTVGDICTGSGQWFHVAVSEVNS